MIVIIKCSLFLKFIISYFILCIIAWFLLYVSYEEYSKRTSFWVFSGCNVPEVFGNNN
jgi:hypothetical protein